MPGEDFEAAGEQADERTGEEMSELAVEVRALRAEVRDLRERLPGQSA